MFCHFSVQAQETKLMLQKADKLSQDGAFMDAISIYREILMFDNNFKAKEGLAQCYKEVNNFNKAEYWYDILLQRDPKNADYQFEYAQMLQNNGKCDKAKKWFKEYAKIDPRGNDFIKACEDHDIFYKNEDEYSLLSMPFNKEGAEFGACYYQNGLIFMGNSAQSGYTDLYFTEILPENSYSRPNKMKGPINSKYNDGPISLNPRGTEMWITRNNTEVSDLDSKGEQKKNLKIMIAASEDGKSWGKLVDFEHNDPDFSIAHPTLSPDGKNLYFVSDKPGGYGGMDIYMCQRNGSKWSLPLNLGEEVNTRGNETFPFIHADGVLYFSSDGHAGLGKFDVFYTSQKGRIWSKPQNIGAPINSNGDDLTFIINENKTSGYFASNRYGTKGDDLFYFKYLNPDAIEVVNQVEKPKDILIKENKIQPSEDRVLNSTIGLGKIIFEYKKSNLTASAFIEIDKVVEHLKNEPNEMVTIESFTDSRGDASDNKILSEDRARIIQNYLIARGITADRISLTGFGEDFLVNKCDDNTRCSDLEHNVNDRVIFKVNNPFSFGDEPEDDEFVSFNDKNKKKRPVVNKKDKNKKEKGPQAMDKSKAEKEAEKLRKAKEKEQERLRKEKEKAIKEKEAKIKSEKKPKMVDNEKTKEKKEAKKPKKEKEPEVVRELRVPNVKSTNDDVGTYYVISAGPYKVIGAAEQEVLQALNITPKIDGKAGKEIILVGNFKSPREALKVLEYLEFKGFTKPKALLYQNGVEVKKVNLVQILEDLKKGK